MNTDLKNKVLNDVEEYLINELGRFYEEVGGKTLMGRIFGLLVTRSEPVSLKVLAEKLNVSKPAISNNVKIGVQMELFKKTYNSDFPREDFYTIGMEFLESMFRPGIIKLNKMLDKFSEAKKIIENSSLNIENDKELSALYNRINFILQAFEIYLEEFQILAVRVVEKLKQARENN